MFVLQFFLWDDVTETVLRHGPLFRPTGLVIGSAVSLYGPLVRRSGSRVPIWSLLPGAVGLIAVGVRGSNGMFVSLATALVLVAFNTPDRVTGGVVRLMSWSPLTALGRRSYSLYLWNLPSMLFVAHFLGTGIAGIGVGLVLTFVIGFASFHLVEIPMLRRFAPKQTPISSGSVAP